MKTEKQGVRIALLLLIVLVLTALTVFGQQKLVLVGGGKRPPAAVERLVEWAGKEKSNILIITWATGEPQAGFDAIKKDFDPYKTASFEKAPLAPLTLQSRAEFIAQVKRATGIFFTGGDQNRIMDVLKDTELLNLLRERYRAGVVLGGTSAGTAIMTDPMMTGEADLKIIDGEKVETREGLGLLPGAIVDQHFIIRQRENRLFGLILKYPKMLGIGINEDSALLVENNRVSEVVGNTRVMFVDASGKKATFLIYLLNAGERFDLVKRRVISKKKSN